MYSLPRIFNKYYLKIKNTRSIVFLITNAQREIWKVVNKIFKYFLLHVGSPSTPCWHLISILKQDILGKWNIAFVWHRTLYQRYGIFFQAWRRQDTILQRNTFHSRKMSYEKKIVSIIFLIKTDINKLIN